MKTSVSDEPEVMRAGRHVYAIFTIMGGVPLLPWVAVIFSKPISCICEPALIFSCYFVGVYYWISRFQVTLTNEQITYRSLFSGLRALRLDEIDRARELIGYDLSDDRLEPYHRLKIWPKTKCIKKPITINMKVFNKLGVKRIRTHLGKFLHE